MTKKDIIDYLNETPHNTNPAVVDGMLDSFQTGDNKEEIELVATENKKVYTPDSGKVYKKVTVRTPEVYKSALLNVVCDISELTEGDLTMIVPTCLQQTGIIETFNDKAISTSFAVPLGGHGAMVYFPNIDLTKYTITATGDNFKPATGTDKKYLLTGDETITITLK